MPEKDKDRPSVGETERSFKPGEDQPYQADLFSRGDQEGRPAPQSAQPDEVAEDPSVLEAGEADGYQTDAFSRGDEEGVPQEALGRQPPKAPGASSVEAMPEGTQRKAVDDADSRDAPPMTGPEGGVR